jgi:uncharacterized protein YdhG (YjbR/CyaY superfamily)
MARQKFTTVDEYIQTFPPETRQVLETIRQTIRKTLPDAEEVISYNIPCFKLRGKYVVYFSGYATHVGLYPRPSDEKLEEKLAPYVSGKGTLRFELDKPMPYELMAKVAAALAQDNLERTGY